MRVAGSGNLRLTTFQYPVSVNQDLYLDKLNKHHLTRNLVHRLERLGYTVTLEAESCVMLSPFAR